MLKNRLFFLMCWFLIAMVTAQNSLSLLTKEKQFIAGTEVFLEFTSESKKEYQIYLSNSYGTTLVNSEINNNKLTFKIPNHICNKIGVLYWELLNSENAFSGQIEILPKEKPVAIETYLGPPSIEAGATDFTMLVVIPTDSLDNPLKQNTAVSLKSQFLVNEQTTSIFTKNLIAYKNIYSPLKSGRMILSSASLGLNSKEYDVNIMPAIATNFKITLKRNHAYADGNQITTFYTSIIKDKNNNIVSDGSFVDFFITNKKGNILKTSGTTINGVAFAKIIHPEWEENWKVKAYMVGIAESNSLEIIYKKVIEKFDVNFSDNNRTLKIGPLHSFMNQMIPDGLQVKLSIYKGEKLLNEIIKKSRDGYVIFNLNANIYKNDIYDIKITTAGISKTFQTKKLW